MLVRPATVVQWHRRASANGLSSWRCAASCLRMFVTGDLHVGERIAKQEALKLEWRDAELKREDRGGYRPHDHVAPGEQQDQQARAAHAARTGRRTDRNASPRLAG